MTASRHIFTLGIAALVTGCNAMAEYEDVSSDPDQKDLIGHEILTTTALPLHAVTLTLGSKHIDLCSITQRPGFDGPEVISRSELPSGTKLRILAVRRCTNCLSKQGVELIVSSRATAICGQAPVKINRSLLGTSIELVRTGEQRT